MKGFVVVGTDTDAGKTALSRLWLSAHTETYAYWKPVETGESDTDQVKRAVPGATVFEPLARYAEAVAPTLAAEREGRPLPTIAEVIAAVPHTELPILLETFGSSLSPFGNVLQAELLQALGWPLVLVSPSTVGAIGRVLQALAGLREYGLKPVALVLMGPPDAHATQQIRHFGEVQVFSCGWNQTEFGTLESLLDSFTLSPLGRGWIHREAGKPGEGIPQGVQSPHPASAFGLNDPLPSGERVNLASRDRATIWHPYTSLNDPDEPLEVVSAEGEFLELADGRRIIDGISSWWTIQHGHRHPPLMDALRQAMAKIDHVMFAGVTHEPAVELAELLLQTAPWKDGRVFYSDNGSTAVEVALKMAYQAWCLRGEPERTLFVGFEDGYHGDTFGAMAAGRDPVFFARFDPLLFRTLRVPVNAAKLAEVLDAHAGQVAGVILEPLVQGAGGMKMHSPQELQAIFEVVKERGLYFIADEVMTGGGRTGTFWAYEQAEIAPDLICSAKTLTGGMMPLAATICSPEIVELFRTPDRTKTFFHGHSFTAHPLACSVATTNLKIMQTGAWRNEVQRIGDFWRKELGALGARVLGSIVALDVPASGGYLADVGREMRKVALAEGVLLRPLGNVIYAMPPYCTSEVSLKRIANAIRKAVAK